MKEQENPQWNIFVAVDSQSDHLPVGSVRDQWNAEALAEKDREISELEDLYRERVCDAARNIRDQYQEYVEQDIAPSDR